VNNILQPVWQKHQYIRDVLTDKKRQSKATHELMDIIDQLKTLGFRHDYVQSEKHLAEHIGWLVKSGMMKHVEAVIQRLIDMEILQREDIIKELQVNFIEFWKEACELLYQSAFITLEDQKYWPLIELEKHLRGKKYTSGGGRFHHILVDEFQDINPLDLNLLKAIAAVNKAELTIVGDDDQAIYEWRGATPSFILNPDDYLDGKYTTCILGTNYRSPKNIVELSQKLIAHNKRRVSKKVKAFSTSQAQVSAVLLHGLTDSVEYVLGLVQDLLRENDCKNIAIIGRKRSQIIPYQIIFAGQNIPFYAAEDLQVFLSAAFNELKDILAIRARAGMGSIAGFNPVNDLLKLCDKIKRYPLRKTDRQSLMQHLNQARPRTIRDALKALFTYAGPLKGDNIGGRMSLDFAGAIAGLLGSKTVAESISAISDHFDGLQKDYGKSIDDIFYADPPFLHLGEYAQRYGDDYQTFYDDIEKAVSTLARIPPEDQYENEDEQWKLPLHLMTALRAKGKEFDTVIVLDANDGIWPSKLAQTEDEIEQERRLFYVATTRARKRLVYLVNKMILDEVVMPTPYLAEMGLSL
jgi:DNA helicase-2/ATP-dependent DNA helicase PcrA